MMGDPGPSDLPVLPSVFGNQVRHDSQEQVLPISGLQASVPTSSSDLYPGQLSYSQPLDHHPSVPFREDGYEEWSRETSQLACGPSTGHGAWVEDHMHGRSYRSGDTLDFMSRARVGEADSSLPLSDVLFTYPKGEDGAVPITGRDLEGLQPGRFLSDNIIDFYIKYLNLTTLSEENQKRFHFFNSFFFTKLLKSTSCVGFDQCKVDYKQLRKWIGEVNLFEKDYVFIPIMMERSHWSLIVICHLKSLDPNALGEAKGSPCILHLDPIDGKHECFEGQVRSFILQAWMERMRAFNNMDVLHALFQMKFIQAKVPQQVNGYDCGLYILQYIEVFLSKSTLQDLTLISFGMGSFFTRPNFDMDVAGKRRYIEHLIFQFGGMLQEQNGSHLSLQPMPQQEVGLVHPQRHQHVLPEHVKEVKSKKWREVETLILLQCMVGGGFCKGKQGAMHWNLIAEEINAKNIGGPMRSKEQFLNRFDTLLKAYKNLRAYCLKMGKEFCNVTKDEKRSLKLATPLGEEHEVWYNHLHTICVQRLSLQGESHKRQKLNLDGAIDVSKQDSSSLDASLHSLPLHQIGSSKFIDPSSRQVVVEKFNDMHETLRYTFFNLIQIWPILTMRMESNGRGVFIECLCRKLAIVQDQTPLKIRAQVYELQDRKLVTLRAMGVFDWDELRDCWMDKQVLEISDFEVYTKLGRKVLKKNPCLKTFLKLSCSSALTIKLCPSQHIRVLSLNKCQELENVDLGHFPNLCYLDIMDCRKLKVINGWKGVKRLGWIEIFGCPSYWRLGNFNQCVQLRRLEIVEDDDLVESTHLKAMRFLEVLSFSYCSALSTIHGLSGLQSLIKLEVRGCESLKMVPDLGCLKALTYLDMSSSGIVGIPGVEELHLLTSINLCGCKSLESLPPLGHLKALTSLDLSGSSIEEIVGVEDLVSLETLDCSASRLKQLPNLDHLHRLQKIHVTCTPLFRVDPSRSFIGGYQSISQVREKEMIFWGDISDSDDSKDISSDEG